MARYFQRPENALKKANEFIEVGKPTRALDTLYDVIKGKRHRAFSEKVIEPIMLKYLELCVDLKKPHTAKEGLYQYRLMCQTVNVGLLEKVIRCYIKMAEERTEAARENLKNKASPESTQQAVAEVDDLENVTVADMQMLNIITEEQAQERSDRAALIPWVKFLWESYTQCLDLLRNNARLENLYHDIAQMAFKFCLSYSRKTEFRKLCERLRKHFDDIVNRASTQMNSIDFSSPETQQFNMETRLAQLDSAITMELWQEAYKAIEDIHLLMNQSKKSQTRMMAYYYQKLSLVFWKAGNLLFHAATLLKYYMLCKDMKKNVSQEELQKNASQVVLATLAIPFPVNHPEFERFVETDKGMLEKSQRLATLLFLPQPPTRASLIRDLSRYNVLGNAIMPLQKLYNKLEQEFSPLSLCADVNTIVTDVMGSEDNAYLQQYIQSLQDIALVRLIKQISQVYQSIEYNHLLEMTVFANQSHLEQLLVDAVRYNEMQITIDHRSNTVKFGSSLAEASREDLPEGPHLQDMPSETVRLQLVNVFKCIEETIDMINPPHLQHEENALRAKIVNHYRMTERASHVERLQRHKIIADRREELERTNLEKEHQEKWKNEQLLAQQQMMEAKRLESEAQERERNRIEKEKRQYQEKINRDKLEKLQNTALGQKIIGKLGAEELENLDVETVMLKKQEELAKEAKEHQSRMRAQEKRLDHLERAKRIEEIPVLEKYLNERKAQEKIEWDAHEKERIATLIEERELAVAHRERMKRMKRDRDQFMNKLLEARRGEFMSKLEDFEKRFADEKARRLEERKQLRREERRKKWQELKEEEERQRLEELRRIEMEKEREEAVQKQLEIEEAMKRNDELRRQKLKEIDEKLKAQEAAASAARPRAAAEASERPAEERGSGGPGAYRPPRRAHADVEPQGDRSQSGAWQSPRVKERKQAGDSDDFEFRRGPPVEPPRKEESVRGDRDLGDGRPREPRREEPRSDWRSGGGGGGGADRGGFGGDRERSDRGGPRRDFGGRDDRENRNFERRPPRGDDDGFDNRRGGGGFERGPRQDTRGGDREAPRGGDREAPRGGDRNRNEPGSERGPRDMGGMRGDRGGDRDRQGQERRGGDRGGFGGEGGWRK